MFSSILPRKCINYVSNCIGSIKRSIKEYQATACGYDERQTRYYIPHAQYDPWYTTSPTQDMETLLKLPVEHGKRIKTMATDLADNVLQSCIHGAFYVSHLIWLKKKKMESYFPKMANDKQANNNDVNNGSASSFGSSASSYSTSASSLGLSDSVSVKSATTGSISSGMADAMNDDMKSDNDGVWTKDINDTVLVQKGAIQPNYQCQSNPTQMTFDDAWAFGPSVSSLGLSASCFGFFASISGKYATTGSIASGVSDAMNDAMKLDSDDTMNDAMALDNNDGIWTKDLEDTVLIQKGTIQSDDQRRSNPTQTKFDDTWGFVTQTLHLEFKDIAMVPPKPPRRVFRNRK